MKAVLDGTIVFEQLELKVGSWERAAVEKAASGLDGIVSVDLGGRGRAIVERGMVRAFSDQKLGDKLDAIRLLMDGGCHTLAVADGEYFDRLRVDSVETGRKTYSGRGVSCEFEARFTQLGE